MNKTINLIVIFMFLSLVSIAQESETERIYREKFTLERKRDSLQKVIEGLQTDIVKEKQKGDANLKSVTDSMSRVIETERKVVKLARDSVNKLQKENARMNSKVQKANLIEGQRDSLKRCLESCQDEMDRLRNDTMNLKRNFKESKASEFSRGQSQVVKQIETRYSMDFDTLTVMLSLDVVQQDLKIINDPKVVQKAQQLLVYFQCRRDLENTCKLQDANAMLQKCQALPTNSKKVKELIETFSQFHIYTEGMTEWIDTLIHIDSQYRGGEDEKDQKYKKGIIYACAMDFIYNYYDFRKYPCIESLFYEILDLKSKNADADVRRFKDRIN